MVDFIIVELVDVKVSPLLAPLCVAFLVLGFDAAEAASLAGGHQVPAHERQIAFVPTEEIAFAHPTTIVVCAGNLYVVRPHQDRYVKLSEAR